MDIEEEQSQLIARLTRERDELKALFEAGTRTWNPVNEVVLKERNEAIEALRWYASDEAWTMQQLEGADGDYGQRARAFLDKKVETNELLTTTENLLADAVHLLKQAYPYVCYENNTDLAIEIATFLKISD